jgi:predicted Zn-dependent protease
MKTTLNSYQQPISFTVSRQQSTHITSAIVPLQPNEEKILTEWQQLLTQAQHINQMAKELEAAILELKEMASTINSHRRFLLLNGEQCKDICEYSTVSLPHIRQKKDGSLQLTKRTVDLFRAEKEAAQLAQQLRQQTKKLASQRHKKQQHPVSFDIKGLFRFLFAPNF